VRRISLLLAVLAALPVAAIASEAKGPNRLFQASASGVSPVSMLLDAASLANTGRTNPELLLAAARASADANPNASTRVKKTEGAKAAAAEKPLSLDPAKLLEAAATAAQPFSSLAEHLVAVKKAGFPASKRAKTYFQTERVGAGATDIFEISFKGTEPAQVGIAGLGEGDIDLRVFDEQWNEICAATSDSSREYCSFVPATTGMFRIRVKNQGKAVEDYVLVTN